MNYEIMTTLPSAIWIMIYPYLPVDDLASMNDLYLLRTVIPKPPILYNTIINQFQVECCRIFKNEKMAYQTLLLDLVQRVNQRYSGNFNQYQYDQAELLRYPNLGGLHSKQPLHNDKFETSLNIKTYIHTEEDRFVQEGWDRCCYIPTEEDRFVQEGWNRCRVSISMNVDCRLKKEYQTFKDVKFLLIEYEPVQHYMSPSLSWTVKSIKIE